MRPLTPVVILVDVDNTLLDNDRIQHDLLTHIEQEFGQTARDRYWALVEDLFETVGYRDYLGALQRYRVEHPHEQHLYHVSSYLVDYPFADRLYPGALPALARLGTWGTTVILSDGDVVYQPRKIERAGLWPLVAGRVLIYIHKERELEDIARLYPAGHYVLLDDKPRILAAVKQSWGPRVTTVFVRQGSYAHDPHALRLGPPADVTVETIGDVLALDRGRLLPSWLAPGTVEGEKR